MNKVKTVLRKPILIAAALLVAGGIWLPSLASAFGQISTRSIELSSSAPDASNVTYKITFTETGAGVAKGIAIDFCSDSPLYQAACTVPTGFDAAGATITGTPAGTSGWAISNITTGHFQISGATANTAATISFEVTGIHNPSTLGSFYARIYTYAGAPDYTSTSNAGTVLDFGGIAMSTVNNINITARVQESLSMCTSAIDISGANLDPGVGTPSVAANKDCSAATAPDIEIGHGSPTKILENNVIDVSSAWLQISTNATTGATIRMKATNSCPQGGLTTDPTGADCSKIPGNASTPTVFAANTAAFGAYVTNGALTAGVSTSSGTLNASSTYNDGTNDGYNDHVFAMDTTTANNNVTSTYGSVIAQSLAPLSQVNLRIDFGATAGLTTPAGIYKGGENLIATGTF